MRIAEIAPPWVRVPPEGYGGIEWIVSILTDGLVDRGHEVTLYATGDSRTRARLSAPFDEPVSLGGKGFYDAVHPMAIQRYDVIHDHTGAMAACLGALSETPVLHTLHGPFNPDVRRLCRMIADKIYFNSISDSQRSGCPELNYVGTIYNAVEVETYPFRSEKEDYALFLGRFSEDKGAHNAIYIAQQAGVPLRMAGKVVPGVDTHYFEERIEPHLDGENIIYEGEVGGQRKRELLAGARFLLFPIQWEEPFGLVMTEALACGTPIVADAMGAASEIVKDSEVGILVGEGEWDAMAEAIKSGRLEAIDPHHCREYVEEHFSVEAMIDGYEAAFEKILADRA
ncbi:MAG: glycosyltransferase family 4 protein [Actinobacteria bacterium]|nr:glycosyltransferase family 4 protein [Actinomycetota bacterium]